MEPLPVSEVPSVPVPGSASWARTTCQTTSDTSAIGVASVANHMRRRLDLSAVGSAGRGRGKNT